jgi:hypothetical protein
VASFQRNIQRQKIPFNSFINYFTLGNHFASCLYFCKWTFCHIPTSDGYVDLLQAKACYEGHSLSIYPGDAPFTINPKPYAMVLSIGYWLGFRGQDSFIFWTYLINLIMLLSSALFLYRFFNRFFPEVAFPSTLLSSLFAPIFYNFFSCTTMPLIFLFISGALSFLESLPIFLLFSLLAGFSRSEGILYYLFLSSIYLGLNRKNTVKIVAGLVLLFSPFLINRIVIGQKVSQEIVTQLMFKYDSFSNVIELGAINFINHIKSTILGLYNPRETFGIDYRGSSIFTLPPLFFIFSIFGMTYEKRKYLVIPTLVFLLLLIAGDSVTLFTGVGYNRHLLCIFPLIFAFSLIGIIKIDKIVKGFLPIFATFFALFFLSQEIILFGKYKKQHLID